MDTRYEKIILASDKKPISQYLKENAIVLKKNNLNSLTAYFTDKGKEKEEIVDLKDEKITHLPLLQKIRSKIKSKEILKSFDYIKENIKIEDNRDRYEKIKDGCEESFEKIQASSGKELVLVIGKTGAGKSTTVNYLLGCQMQEKEDDDSLELSDKSTLPPAAMGNGGSSTTTYPGTYTDKEGFIYCDCPGFEDNRDPATRVCTSLSTEIVVKEAKSIKAAMVVIEWSSIVGDGKGKGLKDLALILGNLFINKKEEGNSEKPKFDHIEQSLLFIITKVPEKIRKNKKTCMKKIKEILDNEQDNLDKLLEEQQDKKKDKDESSRSKLKERTTELSFAREEIEKKKTSNIQQDDDIADLQRTVAILKLIDK